MKKLSKKLGLIIVMCLCTMLFAACSETASVETDLPDLPEEINFGIQRMPNDEIIAMQEGLFDKYFTDKGIKCNFITFDSGSAVNTALASGSIDFGLLGSSPATIALALGFDVEMIWIHEVLGEIESLVVKNDSGIESVEDLAGKRVATPVASTAHYSLLNGLKNAGIEDQVEILDMQPSDIVAAWERGDIEAAYVWQPALANLLEDGKIILSSEDMANQGTVTANVELVSTQFAQKYPELVVDYVACMMEANAIYREDPNKAATIVSEALEITPEEALEQMTGSIWLSPEEALSESYFGTSDQIGDLARIMKETGDFLLEQNSIEESPSQEAFDAFVNGEYIEKAAEMLGQ